MRFIEFSHVPGKLHRRPNDVTEAGSLEACRQRINWEELARQGGWGSGWCTEKERPGRPGLFNAVCLCGLLGPAFPVFPEAGRAPLTADLAPDFRRTRRVSVCFLHRLLLGHL